MTTYYFSDNQSGAHASAVPGNNANAGTSAGSPKRTLVGFNLDALAAGDQVLLAQGGAWDGFSAETTNLNATPTNPLVFGTYAPPSGATGMPILRTSSGVAFQFGGFGGGNPQHGGYTIRDLSIRGAVGTWGVLLVDNVRNVTIENCEITGHDHGIYGTGLTSGQTNANLTVRGCNIHHNFANGLLGGADGCLIENNTFSKNGKRAGSGSPPLGSGVEHNIYYNGHSRTRLIFRNNLFEDPGCAESDGTVTQGNLTLHGEFDQVLIENNRVINSNWAFGGGGISVTQGYDAGYSEVFNRTVVRGNRIVNGLLEISNAPGIIVESNLVAWTQAVGLPLIWICARDGAPAFLDVPDQRGKIRNNSCYVAQANSGLVVIQTNGFGGGGANMEVTNNLVYVAANSGTSYGFGHQALGQYTAHRNNLVYAASGTTAWSQTYSTLSAAQAAGFDASSLNVNPLLVAAPSGANSWAMLLQGGSPALAAGNTTYRARLAIDGWLRPSTPSIGAFDANNP